MPVRRRTAPRRAVELPETRRASSGTATCPTSARASATASASTGPTTPSRATAATRQAAARPLRQGDRGRGRLGRGAASPTSSTTPDEVNDARLGAAHAEVGRHQPVLRLGQRPPPAHAVQRDGHLRGARQGPDEDPPGHPGGHPRHLRRARPPGDASSTTDARRHGDRADAGAPVRARHAPASTRGCATTGATTRSASSPRTTTTPPPGSAASRCRSSRRWSRRCTRPGIEVILDVVYNHTAEGNHMGPTLSFRGIDNAVLLPARRRRPDALLRHHRHRQHACSCGTRTCCS